jgi:hypothetical protein
MTADGEDAEQTAAAMLARIVEAPTRACKVSALIDVLDWMRSIQVDARGAQPGHATREQRNYCWAVFPSTRAA